MLADGSVPRRADALPLYPPAERVAVEDAVGGTKGDRDIYPGEQGTLGERPETTDEWLLGICHICVTHDVTVLHFTSVAFAHLARSVAANVPVPFCPP